MVASAESNGTQKEYQTRLERLQEQLKRRKIDALLVGQPENRFYLSGYHAIDHSINESSGALFIPARGEARLLTDFRFKLQAENETSLPVTLYPKGLTALLNSLILEHGVKRFGFESHYTLHSFSLKLADIAERRGIDLVPIKGLVEKMRLVKSEQEIEAIRRAVKLNETVFRNIFRDVEVGMSEAEISLMIETAMRQAGAERPSFDTIVASSVNGALPHAVPGSRKIESNKPITIDMGLILAGYCSDMTRNFVLGKADKSYLKIHRLVRKAQQAGISAVRSGLTMRDVDRTARQIIADDGYGKFFGHSLGHGVGLAVHEAPRVSSLSRQKLKPGMVITIEPGIYLPGWGGVRLENMVVVREEGCEILNSDTTWLDI